MGRPKMLPCPKCGRPDLLEVLTYDHGWRHVECTSRLCDYLGPGEGSIREAIKAHNRRCAGVAKAAEGPEEVEEQAERSEDAPKPSQ